MNMNCVASRPFSRKMTCARPPVPTVFFSIILKMISPSSTIIPSSNTKFEDFGSGEWWILRERPELVVGNIKFGKGIHQKYDGRFCSRLHWRSSPSNEVILSRNASERSDNQFVDKSSHISEDHFHPSRHRTISANVHEAAMDSTQRISYMAKLDAYTYRGYVPWIQLICIPAW